MPRCAALAFTWLKLGWPGLVALAAVAVLALGVAYLLWPEWFIRHVVQAARDCWRHWFYRRRWMAAMTLAGLAPTYRGRVLVPVLADCAGGRGGGPGDGAAGDRAGSAGLRRPDTEPRPRVRRATVPGPRRPAGPGDAGVRPLRHPRRPDRRASRRPHGEPGRAAGGPLRGRHAVAAAAARLARADRRGDRLGQGLGDLVGGAGAAARHPRRLGPGLGARPEADGTVLRPGPVHPLRRHRRPPWSGCSKTP